MTDHAEARTLVAAPAIRTRPLDVASLFRWAAILAIALGALRIALTYDVLSATFDEPAHIAAGMQLLDKGEFTYEPLHPPLSRLAVALGPYLAGFHSQNGGDLWIEGRRLFYGASGHADDELLILARLGVLPFFVLCAAAVWRWSAIRFGPMTGAIAVILLTNLPLFLAHAGLATTDATFAASFVLAFFAFLAWLERPDARRGGALGLAVALAVTAKLSALLFLPAACGAVLLHRWLVERGEWNPLRLLAAWRGALAALLAFLATAWVVYGCRLDPLYGPERLAEGIRELLAFGAAGQASYFLGDIRSHGWWSFFPVLIAVKTPLPFLIALAIGIGSMWHRDRRDWRRLAPLLGGLAVLLAVIPAPINIGARHVLPIFPLLAIVAARGLAIAFAASARRPAAGLAALALLTWTTIDAAAAHPDYLAYFNELTGAHPERIAAGSDLDWGQDVKRLAAALRERDVGFVHLAIHTSGDLRRHDLPPFAVLYPGERRSGWVAISAQMRAFYCAVYRWLDDYRPVARIGGSIELYEVPSGADSGAPPQDPATSTFNWAAPQPCAAPGAAALEQTSR
jgi:hypothetical protein